MADTLDVKIDLKSGRTYIDETTGDAMLIKNEEVVIQDAAIRLRTQIGTVQRMGLNDFGWNYLSKIKEAIADSSVEELISEMKNAILLDDRIEDVEIEVQTDPINDDVSLLASLFINGNIFPLTVTL